MRNRSDTIFLHKRKENAAIRLFCFPYSGGGRSAFRPWIKQFGDSIETFTVQYPGREGRAEEPLVSDFLTLAEELCEALIPYCDKPFAFFGHSLGGILAYEIIHLLKLKIGISPQCFFASVRPPQIVMREERPLTKNMSDQELLDTIKNNRMTPGFVLNDESIISYYLPILRNDFTLYQDYNYKDRGKVLCPIYGMGGDDDHTLTLDEIRQWRTHSNGKFEAKQFRGNHFYFKTQSKEVVEYMTRHLLPSEQEQY